MCGIVGYAGKRQAAPILLDGLKRLEYRGYDSAGIAVLSDGEIGVSRSAGKLSSLRDVLSRRPLPGFTGLGHTRWATHGGPSEDNAHPHRDCAGRVAVIHNGIIENYLPLKSVLAAKGHSFRSATDTEVVAHLIEDELKGYQSGAPEEALTRALRAAMLQVRGSYALAVVWTRAPGVIAAAKSDSPLVIGLGDDEHFMASDVPAFLPHTRRVIYLEDGEQAVLRGDRCDFYDPLGKPVAKTPMRVEWDDAAAEKQGYSHFMLKEINEQPRAVEDTLRGRLAPCPGALEGQAGMSAETLRSFSSVQIVACGTSWHAGLYGKYLLERYAGIQTLVETASEFRYRQPVLAPKTLVVAVSQSGETADTLAAVRLARQSGLKVLSIGNTIGAAIPRHSDFTLQTCCGPECGVASTKAYTGQLAALAALTLHLAAARWRMGKTEARAWVSQLNDLPRLLEQALRLDAQTREIAKAYSSAEHFLYIGRGVNYPTALEGALKLKEISYIHAEGFSAGEMKHGPLALVDSRVPVVAVATQGEQLEKTLSNIEEARARGARVIALCTQGERRLEGAADWTLELPATPEPLSPIVNIIPLQLLAYHAAALRGCDVDQPRNLAKSVTVE